jgi:hypothetical protein
MIVLNPTYLSAAPHRTMLSSQDFLQPYISKQFRAQCQRMDPKQASKEKASFSK